jgi:hypothetical protein
MRGRGLHRLRRQSRQRLVGQLSVAGKNVHVISSTRYSRKATKSRTAASGSSDIFAALVTSGRFGNQRVSLRAG